MAKKKLEMKFVKHAHRKAFYEYLRDKGRDKFTLSHVYWYMYLRSGKGNVFHLADELAAADLGMGTKVLRDTHRILAADGWITKVPARRVPDWTVNTAPFVGTHKETTHKETTHFVGTHKAPTAVVVHIQGSSNPDDHTSPVTLKGVASSSLVSEQVSCVSNLQEDNEPQTPQLGSEDKSKTKTNPEELDPVWSEARQEHIGEAEAVAELKECFPVFKAIAKPTPGDKRLMAEIILRCEDYCMFPRSAMEYARKHKQSTPGLIPRSPQGLWDAICGPAVSATNGLAAQAKDHDPAVCGLCVKELKALPCSRCHGSTYGNPAIEHGRPFCSNCMKLPEYRRHPTGTSMWAGTV